MLFALFFIFYFLYRNLVLLNWSLIKDQNISVTKGHQRVSSKKKKGKEKAINVFGIVL